MDPMSLLEVVLNNENDGDERTEPAPPPRNVTNSIPIKGLDESVTITVTRTAPRPSPKPEQAKRTGKPAAFAMLVQNSNMRGFSKAPASAVQIIPREELVCKGCERVFKYKAAFIRHEALCGLPVALRLERSAIIEAKKAEKAAAAAAAAAEIEKRKSEEKGPELRCPSCLKQFQDAESHKNHDLEACAAERATYTFVCSVCQARFKYKNHMRRHEDSHNNVRRYECDVCTTAFLRPDHLKRHMMRMHGIIRAAIPAPPVKPKKIRTASSQAVQSPDEKKTRTVTKNAPMQCPMCSKILSRRDHVLRHMRNVHHLAYPGSRKRRSVELYAASQDTGTFDGDEAMEFESGYSMDGEDDDDDDGSENNSNLSPDGSLQIDESYENLKGECVSIEEEEESDDDPLKPDMLNSNAPNSASVQVKPEHQMQKQTQVNSLNQDNVSLHIKAEPKSPKSLENFQANLLSNSPADKGTNRVGSFPAPHQGQKGTNDGNQNVVRNGVMNVAGDDWISDLVNQSGW